MRSTSTATEVLREEVGERVHLAVAPIGADGRHLSAPIADDPLDELRVLDRRVAQEPRPDVALAFGAVALGAGAREGLRAELRRPVLLRLRLVLEPLLELLARHRLDLGRHRGVLDPAEL